MFVVARLVTRNFRSIQLEKGGSEMQEQIENLTETDFEFVGELEEVTMGWTGPTDDIFDGDWTP